MNNLMQMEWYRIKYNKFFVGCALLSIIYGLFASKSYIADLTTHKDAIGIFYAMVYDSTVWLVLFSAIVALMIGHDFTNRTIHLEVVAGHSRIKIFFSKCLIYLAVFNLLMLLGPVVGSIRMSFQLGWGDSWNHDALYILRVILFSLLLNSAVFSVCIFFAFIFKDSAKTVSVSMIVLFISAMCIAYAGPMGWYDVVPWLRFLPMNQIRASLAYSLSLVQATEIALSGIVYLLLFIALSFQRFNTCELK
ncbi:ABC transporter permease [Paenibacillus sp. FSL R7-0297]|uniref:ABC transporter permease n=1 Tax=unclassified Paenibacillus TaxID=185978 RepID=UPI0006949672|nr:ABC transporter permease [Paenibacillus sp. FSL R5-0912]